MLFKKKSPTEDPRKSNARMDGGRRTGENDNPYLSARRTWNDHTRGVVASRQVWQIFGMLSMLIALGGIGGMIHIGSQSKFVPYVIEVDKLGQPLAIARADKGTQVDPRIIRAAIAAFVSDARTVTPDTALQRKAVFAVYAMLAPDDPATQKMNDWLNGNEDASPFKRAQTEMVNIEIGTVLPQTPETWQVDWIETTRDRQGLVKGQPAHMRALVTVYSVEPTPATTEEQLHKNPLGIFVRNFSWSKQTQLY
jgi:type IV secretion system protein TrbF